MLKKFSEHVFGMDVDDFFSAIDTLYDEILIYDANYNIVYVNQACSRHYACFPQEMIGKSFFDFVNEDCWKPSILPVIYKDKKTYAIKQKTFIGSELTTIAVPIFDKENNLKYVCMNVRDEVNEADLWNPHYISKDIHLAVRENPISESTEMKKVFLLAERISKVSVTCILTGESGVGKTMIGKYIHSISPRKNKPFINLNCASIPNELVESELFGYTKGAFTGANANGKKGLFEAANHGTLLLDEISELSLATQAKLLHVLQDNEFIPIGGSKPVKVDVRIIAATNKNLRHLVASGRFREDLFYRLNVVEIYIPPLRKRKKDIPYLVQHFLNEFSQKYGVSRHLTENAITILKNYDWPGNVRELRHLIERLIVTIDSLVIDETLLPKNLFGIIDTLDFQITEHQGTLSEKMASFESSIIQDAYKKCGSSRKVAEYLSISQTKANKLISKYVQKNKI